MGSVLATRTAIRGLAGASPLALVVLLGAPPAAADTPDHKGQIEEVVVTAEKRSGSIQKTPISITALTGKDLVAAGIGSVLRVAEQVPGISFKTGGPGQTELEMRGLNSAGGNSPTVGFYLDETPITTFAYATAGKGGARPQSLRSQPRGSAARTRKAHSMAAGSMGRHDPPADQPAGAEQLPGAASKASDRAPKAAARMAAST